MTKGKRRRMVRGAGHKQAAKARPQTEYTKTHARMKLRTKRIAQAKAALGDTELP